MVCRELDPAPAVRLLATDDFPEQCSTAFGITSNTLVRSGQSSSGPAGGASEGYGLGKELLARTAGVYGQITLFRTL